MPEDPSANAGGAGGAASVGGSGPGSGGGSSGEGGGVGGGSIVPERCDNGEDDDGDGKVDCADDECTEFLCAPVPADWVGPLAFVRASSDMPLPGCPDAWPSGTDLTAGSPTWSPAECSACECGAPEVVCSLATWHTFSNSSCGSVAGSATPQMPATCYTWSSIDFDAHRGEPPTVVSASCTPLGGDATVSEVGWDAHARACEGATEGGGCGDKAVCVPKPEAFRVCLVREGDHACPEPYGDKELIYGDYDDQRGCAACSCGNPSNPTCTAKTEVWAGGNTTCNGNPQYVFDHNNACNGHNAYNDTTGGYKYHPTGTASPCPASGGAPEGSVEPTLPTTVCCLP